MRVIISCDPDSNKNGVAVYRNNVLCELLNFNSIQLYKWLFDNEKLAIKNKEIVIVTEDPMGNSSSTFSHIPSDRPVVKYKKSESVGRVKQAQVAIEQVAEELGIPVVKYKNSSMWKKTKDKAAFERATGWTGRSNEETRSAAWFGYLHIRNVNRITKHNS